MIQFKKMTAFGLSLYLGLFNSLSYAAPFEALQRAGSKVQGEKTSQVASADAQKFSIPSDLGTVEEVYNAPCAKHSAPCHKIFYIQDAHDSLEAQENISKLVRHYVGRHQVATVFEEGYEGAVPSDELFSVITDSVLKEKVAYYLMDKLRIGGAEYAHITRHVMSRGSRVVSENSRLTTQDSRQNFKLIGADNLSLHTKALQHYQTVARERANIDENLNIIEARLKNLSDKTFPTEMKTWMKLRARFDAGQLEMLDYLKRLEKQTREIGIKKEVFEERYPQIHLLLSAENSKDSKVLASVQAMDFRALFREVKGCEEALAEKLLKSQNQKTLFDFLETIRLVKRLSRIEMTPEEFESVRGVFAHFKTQALADFLARETHQTVILSKAWEEVIQHAVQFYELAGQRNGAISQTLDQFLKQSKEVSAVLVYGGFHKKEITKMLREKNISYQAILPRISSFGKAHQEAYHFLMAGGNYNFELPFLLARADRVTSLLVLSQGNLSEARTFVGNLGTALAIAGRSELRNDELLKLILYSTSEGIIVVDKGSKKIKQGNSAAEKFFGKPFQIGTDQFPNYEFIPMDDLEKIATALINASQAPGTAIVVEEVHGVRTVNGTEQEFPIRLKVVATTESKEFIFFIQDDSEAQAAAKKVQETHVQAQKNWAAQVKSLEEQLAQLGQQLDQLRVDLPVTFLPHLASGLGDRINNPLMGLLSVLESAGTLNKAFATPLLKRIKSVVAAFQDLASKIQKQRIYLDAQKTIEDAVREFSKPDSISIHFDSRIANPENRILFANEEAFKSMITHLLKNARKAIEEKGAASGSITVTLQSGAAGQIQIQVQDDGAGIQDDGAGIDEKKQEHIFNPLVSDWSKSGTLGFGLFETRMVAEAYRGSATLVQSQLGQGSTFQVELPAVSVREAILLLSKAKTEEDGKWWHDVANKVAGFSGGIPDSMEELPLVSIWNDIRSRRHQISAAETSSLSEQLKLLQELLQYVRLFLSKMQPLREYIQAQENQGASFISTPEQYRESIKVIEAELKPFLSNSDIGFEALQNALGIEISTAALPEVVQPPQPPEPAVPQNPIEFSPRKILVVDDIELVRLATEIKMQDLFGNQVKVVSASNGAEGVQAVQENADIDLIIMDKQMPGMTGIEAAREISQEHPNILIVMLSGNVVDDEKPSIREAGITAIVTKPNPLTKEGILAAHAAKIVGRNLIDTSRSELRQVKAGTVEKSAVSVAQAIQSKASVSISAQDLQALTPAQFENDIEKAIGVSNATLYVYGDSHLISSERRAKLEALKTPAGVLKVRFETAFDQVLLKTGVKNKLIHLSAHTQAAFTKQYGNVLAFRYLDNETGLTLAAITFLNSGRQNPKGQELTMASLPELLRAQVQQFQTQFVIGRSA